MIAETYLEITAVLGTPFYSCRRTNDRIEGRKAQTYELKIHLTLKINCDGRSAHDKINIIRTHQKIHTYNYNTIFIQPAHVANKLI